MCCTFMWFLNSRKHEGPNHGRQVCVTGPMNILLWLQIHKFILRSQLDISHYVISFIIVYHIHTKILLLAHLCIHSLIFYGSLFQLVTSVNCEHGGWICNLIFSQCLCDAGDFCNINICQTNIYCWHQIFLSKCTKYLFQTLLIEEFEKMGVWSARVISHYKNYQIITKSINHTQKQSLPSWSLPFPCKSKKVDRDDPTYL